MSAEQNQLLRHAGYAGSVEASLEDGCLHGRILHIDDLITYEAQTVGELRDEFIAAVDRYLAHCQATGKAPNKPYTGSFNVRVGADRHRWLTEAAAAARGSINEMICEAIDSLRKYRVGTGSGAVPALFAAHHRAPTQSGIQITINSGSLKQDMHLVAGAIEVQTLRLDSPVSVIGGNLLTAQPDYAITRYTPPHASH